GLSAGSAGVVAPRLAPDTRATPQRPMTRALTTDADARRTRMTYSCDRFGRSVPHGAWNHKAERPPPRCLRRRTTAPRRARGLPAALGRCWHLAQANGG